MAVSSVVCLLSLLSCAWFSKHFLSHRLVSMLQLRFFLLLLIFCQILQFLFVVLISWVFWFAWLSFKCFSFLLYMIIVIWWVVKCFVLDCLNWKLIKNDLFYKCFGALYFNFSGQIWLNLKMVSQTASCWWTELLIHYSVHISILIRSQHPVWNNAAGVLSVQLSMQQNFHKTMGEEI